MNIQLSKTNAAVAESEINFSFYQAFKAQFKAELLLRWRSKGALLQPLIFFVLVLSLFPLAINVSSATLAKLAPGILWVIVLLATLFSAEHLFREDFRDGSLAANALSLQPLSLYVTAKLLVHWLVVAIPLSLSSPIMALMLNLPAVGISSLMLSVALGGLSLSLIAGFGAALTVSVGQKSMLLALIALPLYIPVLIFASAAVQLSIDGYFPHSLLLILLAGSVLALMLLPLAIGYALRVSLELR